MGRRLSGLRPRRVAFAARALAAAMVLTTLVYGTRPAHGDPADIFQIAAPTIGGEPPKAATINAGDVSVSTQTGAVQYGYPISVPPGRHGMQPHLSLNYSSQGPIYGTLAAGWSLSGIPIITQDTSRGVLRQQVSGNAELFKSSMAGDRPLIPVTEWASESGVLQQYRAQDDATFARYEQMASGVGYTWKVYTTDGVTRYFGNTDAHIGNCFIASYGYAPLTREVDAFSNEVNYYYTQGVNGECVISNIKWGRYSGASTQDFAEVDFSWNSANQPSCNGIPVGSQSNYRTGTKIVTGASELDVITIYAYPLGGNPSTAVHTRTYRLSYDATNAACTGQQHAPFRALTSIQETAQITNSPLVTLPAATFTYGDANITYPAYGSSGTSWTVPWSGQSTPNGAPLKDSLSWGYRFTIQSQQGAGKWPTMEATLLDMDGDGLLDRVWNAPQTGSQTYCGASWQKNLGNGQFGTAQSFVLPTLKWWNGTGPSNNAGPSGTVVESCSLNYQETGYANRNALTCPGGEQPNSSGYCAGSSDYGTDALSTAQANCGTHCPPSTTLAYRWIDWNGDGMVDLVASPVVAHNYNLQYGTNGAEPNMFGSTFGLMGSCPTPSVPGANAGTASSYSMCGGMFPYFVYLNHGNGWFGLSPSYSGLSPAPDQVVYQPMMLESFNGDSSISGAPTGQYQGALDVDGDGYPDAVSNWTGATAWSVFRNNGFGSMVPITNTTSPFTFTASGRPDFLSCSMLNTNTGDPSETDGLVDVNGDGLPDHWASGSCTTPSNPTGTATATINNGSSFLGDSWTTNVRPGNESTLHASPAPTSAWICQARSNLGLGGGNCTRSYLSGVKTDVNRVLDLDADGRVDVVQTSANSPNNNGIYTSTVYYNEGGQFPTSQNGQSYSGWGINHWGVATQYSTSQTWEVRSDMVDLNGDGLLDAVDFSDPDHNNGIWPNIQNQGTAYLGYGTTTTPNQPPRLLKTISNGRGDTTTINYAPSTNGNVVVQTPGVNSNPATNDTNRTMPHLSYVVSSVSTVDSLASTTTTTGYKYRNPHQTNDPDTNHWALRGFDEVDTTLPSGAVRKDFYDYTVDWSGRLAKTLTIPSEAPSEVRSVDATTWTKFTLTLAVGSVDFFHATSVDHWTCRNGQNEDTCEANTDTYTHTISTLQPIGALGDNNAQHRWMYVKTAKRLQLAASAANGDRETDMTYELIASGSAYRLLPLTVTNSQQQNGALVMYGKTAHSYDATNTVAITDEVWTDAVDADRLVTQRAYDMTTGNVVQRWKPKQNPNAPTPGDGTSATYLYDSRNLFVATECSEPNGSATNNTLVKCQTTGPNANGTRQERDYIWEYGTGTKLETIGPNVAPCYYPQNGACPAFGSTQTLPQEDHRIVVDGLGRTLQRWETFMRSGGNDYVPVEVEIDSYIDSANSSVTHQQAIDGGINAPNQAVRYTLETTLLDGHGRPLQKTTYAQGAAPANQVTTYQFNSDGTLGSVTVPDPSANDTSTVKYTYAFDSLGRPTSIRRPDASLATNQSGVNMSYNGLITTSSEYLGSGGGVAAVTQTIKDAFGRLVEVDEQTSPNGPTWAATKYGKLSG
jgi:hypothetical protein